MACLQIKVNGKEVARRELSGPLVLGRAEDCDVSLKDHLLSRRHCRVEPTEDGWVLVDLQSKNGTLVDGKRVTRHRFSAGDVVRLGATELRFLVAADAKHSLDDEVLAMLSNDAPSPALDGSGLSGLVGDDDPDASEQTVQDREPESPGPAAPAFSAAATAAPPGPRVGGKSLWEQAVSPAPEPAQKKTRQQKPLVAAEPVATRKLPGESGSALVGGVGSWFSGWFAKPGDDPDAPWYKRKIPLPVALAAAALFGAGLYFWINYTPGGPPPPPRVHRPPPKYAD